MLIQALLSPNLKSMLASQAPQTQMDGGYGGASMITPFNIPEMMNDSMPRFPNATFTGTIDADA